MGDDITISGGGTRVATEALYAARDSLVALSGVFGELSHSLRPATAVTTSAPGPDAAASGGVGAGAASAADAARLAYEAVASIRYAASQSTGLARSLGEAAASYDAAEAGARSGMDLLRDPAFLNALSTLSGWALGQLAPFAVALGIVTGPTLVAALAAAFGAGSLADGSPSGFLGRLEHLLGSKASLLRDPRMVALVRYAVSSTDDAILGAAGAPLSAIALAGDQGTGAFGIHGAARVIVGAGSTLGLLRETPVRVDRVSAGTVTPPSDYTDLVRRIPSATSDGPQVRIERYAGSDGDPVYLVYVGGTVDWDPVTGDQPFDVTSDLTGVAQLDPASLRATQEAMREAGIQRGDTVIPVGYSQGGIIATDLATSGEYITPTLVTFGSPTGGVAVPAGVTDIAVEHTDDLVPALGGLPSGTGNDAGDRVLITRQTFDREIPSGSSPADAHRISEYAITAQQMDATTDLRLAAGLAALPTGSAGEAGLYRGVRTTGETG
ncbi:hypothetical protein ACX9R5_03570 [Rathayibacter sp. CAU 1779]